MQKTLIKSSNGWSLTFLIKYVRWFRTIEYNYNKYILLHFIQLIFIILHSQDVLTAWGTRLTVKLSTPHWLFNRHCPLVPLVVKKTVKIFCSFKLVWVLRVQDRRDMALTKCIAICCNRQCPLVPYVVRSTKYSFHSSILNIILPLTVPPVRF